MKYLTIILFCFISYSNYGQKVIVLGIAQDGGFPHIGCQNECLKAHRNSNNARYITSLALIDPASKKWWMFEATPDMDKQLQYFRDLTDGEYPYLPEGIFVTHAHIGHYTGLMFLGKEAFGAQSMKVYALPKMIDFLKTNGPWSQLVELGNIELISLTQDQAIDINESISAQAFTVPHRDEFSETAGFKVVSGNKGFLFIPDIDKWFKWDRNIVEMVSSTDIDYAFLDATFYDAGELPNRPMNEVPHPFVSETMAIFDGESDYLKRKIHFIHLNHTNPLLFDKRKRSEILKKGYKIAEQGTTYD
ncbi:MBL fold metallo-hydrolase [Ekhidna sp.]|jgi:pyrroloquinoline quinone biosynthesis protein B|uniref:MBL fold metallo-hydrolase n=1 Tax=Ekhidna sp. TaxID=2608089 RepID=UPI0032EEAAAF